MSGRSRFMPGDVVPLIAAHDAREAVALDAQFRHAQNLTPMGQIDDTRLAVWTCPGCMYDQPSDPHPDAHCAEYVKRRGFCGDIECFCPCHRTSEPDPS